MLGLGLDSGGGDLESVHHGMSFRLGEFGLGSDGRLADFVSFGGFAFRGRGGLDFDGLSGRR